MSNLRPPVRRTTDQNPERKRRAAFPFSAFRTSASSVEPRFGVSAFTLVEMMVVVGIIVLLVSITLPAIGPMLASNEQAQAANTLGGLLINAQATASQTATCVGLRIERAFKTDNYGLMLDTAGRSTLDPSYSGVPAPAQPEHQQVRFVTLAAYKDGVFRQTVNTRVFELPKNFWLAPDYALNSDWPHSPRVSGNLAENNVKQPMQASPDGRQPQILPDGGKVAAYSLLETFYILFSFEGELVLKPTQWVNYADQTQQYWAGSPPTPTTPYLLHPDSSARSVFVYDRRQWKDIPDEDSAARTALLKQSWPININRVTGSAVQEKSR